MINVFAWTKALTSALPFVTIVFILFMWALVTIPLTILGGITTGRSRKEEHITDTTTSNTKPVAAKPIPGETKNWVISFLGGLLPVT